MFLERARRPHAGFERHLRPATQPRQEVWGRGDAGHPGREVFDGLYKVNYRCFHYSTIIVTACFMISSGDSSIFQRNFF